MHWWFTFNFFLFCFHHKMLIESQINGKHYAQNIGTTLKLPNNTNRKKARPQSILFLKKKLLHSLLFVLPFTMPALILAGMSPVLESYGPEEQNSRWNSTLWGLVPPHSYSSSSTVKFQTLCPGKLFFLLFDLIRLPLLNSFNHSCAINAFFKAQLTLNI